MTSSMPAASWPLVGWTLAGHRGTCHIGRVVASVDLDAPADGLTVEWSPADTKPDHLLGLDLGSRCPPNDHWLRGPDITAAYEPSDQRQLRATALWRRHSSEPDVAAWQLIASAQTSLLDSDPAIAVVSSITAAESSCLARGRAATWTQLRADALPVADASAVLVPRSNGYAVLVAAHPADAPNLTVSREQGRIRLVCRLFTQQLEKGVLLRSRVLAAVGPSGDTAWADSLLAEFHAAPPPLTT
jgi:hypothetical protein